MGNCCGKSSSENFHGEGRTLGAAPANAPSQPGRANLPPKISTSQGGRTLGANPQTTADAAGPRAAAARAAEERAKASTQGKGKLGKQLDAQKAQTQSDALAESARVNVATRDADAAAQTRNWD